MKSSNPHSGIHETEIAKCLDTMCLDPSCNQGGQLVCFRKTTHPRNPAEGQGYEQTHVSDTLNVYDNGESRTPMLVVALEGNGARPSHMGKGFSEDGTMYTLNTIEQHSVCYAEEGSENIDVITKQLGTAKNIVPSLEATDYKEPVGICYTVDCRNLRTNHEVSGTLQAKDNGGFSYNYLNPILKENE